jgi:hypothetical protein
MAKHFETIIIGAGGRIAAVAREAIDERNVQYSMLDVQCSSIEELDINY